VTDWKTLTAARGLHLPDAEVEKLASVMDALEPAYEALATRLTLDIEPATTLGDQTVDPR
jgi:hypothetical protein